MPDTEKNILIQSLRSGNEQAYEELYYLYHKRLYSFAFKYIKSKELAEDAVQDTFIKLWDQRGSIHSNIKGFLFTSVRNHVLNMIRNKKRKVLKHIQLEQQRTRRNTKTEDVILYSEYQQILQQGLDQLPEGKREIFMLKSSRDLSNREIADQLNISVHTVKSQYYQASKFIKRYLGVHADINISKRESG